MADGAKHSEPIFVRLTVPSAVYAKENGVTVKADSENGNCDRQQIECGNGKESGLHARTEYVYRDSSKEIGDMGSYEGNRREHDNGCTQSELQTDSRTKKGGSNSSNKRRIEDKGGDERKRRRISKETGGTSDTGAEEKEEQKIEEMQCDNSSELVVGEFKGSKLSSAVDEDINIDENTTSTIVKYVNSINRLGKLKTAYEKSRRDFVNGKSAEEHEFVDFDGLAEARNEGAVLAYSLGLFVFLGVRRVKCHGIKLYGEKNVYVLTNAGNEEVDRLLKDPLTKSMFQSDPDFEKKCRNGLIKVQNFYSSSIKQQIEISNVRMGKGEFYMILKGVKKTFFQGRDTSELTDSFEPKLVFEAIFPEDN